MVEFLELRVRAERAGLVFGPDEGTDLGIVRKVTIRTDDPRMDRIRKLERWAEETDGPSFFFGWVYIRRYTKWELEAAELFKLWITTRFEPAGEQCGTIYDESTACSFCGAGRRQMGDLVLDLRKAPKKKDIARTIANDEWIVSERLVGLLQTAGMTGVEFRPIYHKPYHEDPIDYTKLEAGRRLLEQARLAGCPFPTWQFAVWVSRPERRKLLDEVEREYLVTREKPKRERPPSLSTWMQPVITSQPVGLSPRTRVGNGPFDDDPEGEYRCPLGHRLGFALLSEVFVKREDWDGADFAVTKEMFGHRMGVLAPSPVLLISPRAYRFLQAEGIKGWSVEVAYLV